MRPANILPRRSASEGRISKPNRKGFSALGKPKSSAPHGAIVELVSLAGLSSEYGGRKRREVAGTRRRQGCRCRGKRDAMGKWISHSR